MLFRLMRGSLVKPTYVFKTENYVYQVLMFGLPSLVLSKHEENFLDQQATKTLYTVLDTGTKQTLLKMWGVVTNCFATNLMCSVF